MEKVCSACQKLLPLTSFNKNKKRKDGHSGQCKSCRKEYSKEYWEKNKERLKARHKEYWKQYYQDNKEKVAVASRKWLRRLKLEVFNAYGGAICICCKESEISFLSIDHVKNNGSSHRHEVMGGKRYAGYHFYQWLKNNQFPDREDFQVLCMNCQFGKAHNKGVCPHSL